MSERVVPDRYGYWIAKTVLGNQVVLRVLGGQGIQAVYTDLRGDTHPVEKFSGEWVAAVEDMQERLVEVESDLADLKRRIAAAPVGFVVVNDKSGQILSFSQSEDAAAVTNAITPQSFVVQVRLLEEPADAP